MILEFRMGVKNLVRFTFVQDTTLWRKAVTADLIVSRGEVGGRFCKRCSFSWMNRIRENFKLDIKVNEKKNEVGEDKNRNRNDDGGMGRILKPNCKNESLGKAGSKKWMILLCFDFKMFFQTSYFRGDLKIIVDPFCFTILPKKSKFKKLFLR